MISTVGGHVLTRLHEADPLEAGGDGKLTIARQFDRVRLRRTVLPLGSDEFSLSQTLHADTDLITPRTKPGSFMGSVAGYHSQSGTHRYSGLNVFGELRVPGIVADHVDIVVVSSVRCSRWRVRTQRHPLSPMWKRRRSYLSSPRSIHQLHHRRRLRRLHADAEHVARACDDAVGRRVRSDHFRDGSDRLERLLASEGLRHASGRDRPRFRDRLASASVPVITPLMATTAVACVTVMTTFRGNVNVTTPPEARPPPASCSRTGSGRPEVGERGSVRDCRRNIHQ
jgi:hypothetical protein